MSFRWCWVRASNGTETPRLFVRANILVVALLFAAFGTATAQQWQGPLARVVTVKAKDVTVANALELLTRSSRVRITYSTDIIPVDNVVTLDYKKTTLGDALRDLLRGVPVQPVAAGDDQVALAPGLPAVTIDTMPVVFALKPVVVQAQANVVTTRVPSMNVTYIGTQELSEQGSITQALNASVPGVWSWQTPMGFTAQYSVRGASSFGATAPKVFIDGIEVANPMLITQIAPENVDHIEFVRGPQGAAMYGADAINGVTNIVTRQNWLNESGSHLRVRSGVALSETDFMTNASLGQDHSASLQMGSSKKSATLNGGYGRSGEYVPGGYTTHFNFDGNSRIVGTKGMLSATARFASQSSRNPGGLWLDSTINRISPLGMQQYTFGMRGMMFSGSHFSHTFVAGVDGYDLSGTAGDSLTMRSVTDSILRAAGDNGVRTTLRLSSVARFDLPQQTTLAFTVSAEHSALQQSGSAADVTSYGELYARALSVVPGSGKDTTDKKGRGRGVEQELPEYAASAVFDQARTAKSFTTQMDASFKDRVYLNAGLRFENDVVNGVSGGTIAMPMVGGAYMLGNEDASVKLRAAYGKGVRWPDMPRLGSWNTHSRVGGLSLSPETQQGVEAGVDVMIRSKLSLQITHYNQTASGLVQSVAVPAPPSPGQGQGQGQGPTRWVYALQNVGEIDNAGWEMQATAHAGSFALGGTLSLTDSKVARVANGYTGDMRAGDRMLGVPSKTFSVNSSYYAQRWSATLTASRAFDWIGYDRARLLNQTTTPTGLALRNYWLTYNGFTHLRATMTRDVGRGFTLMLTGDNLFGKQLGEPDNLTVVPGRTISLGAKASF